MTITVHIELGYEFSVKAPAAEVFEVLSDVPTSASHFPKVDQLVDLGNNTYRWEMEKIGLAQVNLQTVYASKYTSNKSKGTVTWTPVKGKATPWSPAAGRSPTRRNPPTWCSRSRVTSPCPCRA